MTQEANNQETIKGKSLWKDALKKLRKDKIAMFGAFIIIILILIAFLADVIAPYNPDKQFKNGTTAYGMPLPLYAHSKKVELMRDHLFLKEIAIPAGTIFSTADNKNNFKAAVDINLTLKETVAYIPVSPVFTEMASVNDGTNLILGENQVEGIKSLTLRDDNLFILGTDASGRDVLSRLIHGSRVSLQVGLIAVTIAVTIGVFLGLVSGFFGGWIDMLIMRLTDITMSFPDLLLVMAIVAIRGPSLGIIFFAIGLVMWTGIARIVRSQVFSVREMEFIEAAKASGSSKALIIFRHVFPNVIAPVIVIATMDIAGAIMTEASLSFLGFGVKVPTSSWGSMINDGLSYFRDAPWLPILPGIFIAITVFAFNLFGDGLRDAIDPKLRNR